MQGLTLTNDRLILSACYSVRLGWTRQIQARLVILISNQHLSCINSFAYDCKLTFSLVERMIVYFSTISAMEAHALLAREIPHDWFLFFFPSFFFPKSLLKTRITNFGIPTSLRMSLYKNAA